jgi:trans-4-hydroxy-L-proline dehydratase
MTSRIQQLREQSLQAINRLSAERALLVTEFHKTDIAQQVSVPVRRALSLKYILENKFICINKDELIVGERGPAPKATPTYPEVTLHTLIDLDILNSREKVFFKVDAETRKAYEDIVIPFWKGKTQRDRLFASLDEQWKDAYNAGLFTEFQEQRAPGHTVNGNKIYSKGLLDIMDDINKAILKLDFYSDSTALHKLEELKAMKISAEALITDRKSVV